MMTAEIVVMAFGLVLIGGFLWQALFTPVEEARLAAYRSARRAPPLPERYRSRGSGLLRVSHPR